MVNLAELTAYTDELLAAAEFSDYCPNGLQVEGRSQIQRVVAGVTACQALLDAALAVDADLILVHHGYFWKGEEPRVIGMKRRRLKTLLAHDMNLLAYHLPLDAHPIYGNNVQLAARLGLTVDGSFGPERGAALGLLGHTAETVNGARFAQHLAKRLQREPLYIAGAEPNWRRIAWCTGAAQSFIDAAIEQGVDAFLTGEASEQTVHSARENGIHFYAAGHHATERYGVQALGQHLAQRFALDYRFIDIPNPV